MRDALEYIGTFVVAYSLMMIYYHWKDKDKKGLKISDNNVKISDNSAKVSDKGV